MKKNILYILVVILILLPDIRSQWLVQSSPNTLDIFSLCVIDSSNAYATSIFYIYKTSDGFSWGTNFTTNVYFDDIYFININTGYSVGRTSGYSPLYKTTNAGSSWVLISGLPVLSTYSLYFIDSNTGFASTLGAVYKTENGGLNWENKYTELTNIRKIFFTDVNSGWGTTDEGNLIRTTNAGANWENLAVSPGTSLNSLFFLNSNTGWIVTENNMVYKSTNNGWVPWIGQQVNNPSCRLDAVYFANDMTGWVTGCEGSIHRTTDGGMTWVEQITETSTSRLTDIQFINTLTGWSVGEGGKILKTTSGGENIIGIQTISNEVPGKFELMQNYPNPFNPSTNILYTIAKSSFVTIQVFDIRGKEVVKLVNQLQNAGTYKTDFKGTELPSGIYFYKLSAGIEGEMYHETKKMMLIK